MGKDWREGGEQLGSKTQAWNAEGLAQGRGVEDAEEAAERGCVAGWDDWLQGEAIWSERVHRRGTASHAGTRIEMHPTRKTLVSVTQGRVPREAEVVREQLIVLGGWQT